jgi:hypothetical protein
MKGSGPFDVEVKWRKFIRQYNKHWSRKKFLRLEPVNRPTVWINPHQVTMIMKKGTGKKTAEKLINEHV